MDGWLGMHGCVRGDESLSDGPAMMIFVWHFELILFSLSFNFKFYDVLKRQ